MNILLVYPEFPDTFWSFKHILKFIRKKAAHVPLGLITIASMLPDDWDLKLVDMNVEDLKDFTGAGLNLTVPNRVGVSEVTALRR